MDQSTEEVLRQELSYLRQKLQDAPTHTPQEYEVEINQGKEEIKRLETMLAGKLLDVTPGSVLFIEHTDSLPEAYQWRKLAEKFNCSIFAAPTPERIAVLDDKDLRKVGLKKVGPFDPLESLDQLMHHFKNARDQIKDVEGRYEDVKVLGEMMDHTFDLIRLNQKYTIGGDERGGDEAVCTETGQ